MKNTTQLAIGVLIVSLLICSNSKEFESKGPIERNTENRVVFIPVGVNLGASCEDGDCGFSMGPEISVAFVWHPAIWFGVFADGLWDFGEDTFRHTFGLEFGTYFLGFEIGCSGLVIDDEYRNGVRGGVFVLTPWYMIPYYRLGGLKEDDQWNAWHEFGILFKYPIGLMDVVFPH